MAEIGRGAMGEVYKARDPLIGRLVALKVITGGLVGRPDLLDRFYQEARSAGALQHPNIVTIYELGMEGDLPFIAMEFLGGESLEKVIARRDPVPLPTKVTYIAKICRALDYAHKHGVVHRDIKPGNIMVTAEGAVKVVDFGIARVVDASKTQTGTLIGTLGYMSPQQLRGEHADERSDIWAVGVLFYELLAYQRPFTGDNPAAMVLSIISKEPAPLASLAAECTPEVEAVIFRMLEKEALDRYQSMDEVLLDLDPVLRELQQGQVDQLIAESEQLTEEGDLKKAQQLLREALYTDPTRQDAKTKLDQVTRELRRQQVRPRVEEHLAKAKTAIDTGQWQQAKSEAQGALQLDSTCTQARELIGTAEKAIERAKEIEKRIRATKQRVATGSLTEADARLDDLLSLDPENRQAQELRDQVRAEISRREKRKERAASLKHARDLWSQLKYEECITVLEELRQTEPEDPEVAKLLETARRDRAEHSKQEKLTEARNLLAAGRYDEARNELNRLLADSPGDAPARNLLTLLEDEEKAKSRQARLQGELEGLRVLVGEGKHGEAAKRGEKLLGEFPGEFELAELVNFARAEVRRAEQARALEAQISKVRELAAKGSYTEAIRLADQVLADAPKNATLVSLRDGAVMKQKEKERREELNRRIRELKERIGRNELTGAIEMAKETLATLGPNTDITQLLQAAETERRNREDRKQFAETLQMASELYARHRYDESLRLLGELQKTAPSDPEVAKLLEAAQRGHAEERKQGRLKESRNLISAARYDNARSMLNGLLAEWPDDADAKQLLARIEEEERGKARQARLESELASLQKLESAGKFQEALERGEKLLGEFPGESGIEKLLKSARKGLAEQRKREGLGRARELLSAKRYDESIELLNKLQSEFPGQAGIGKLLNAVRHDLAEQQKQQKLTEARRLLAARSYAEAMTLVDGLAAGHSKDAAIGKLRADIRREQEQQARTERVQQELNGLKKLMEAKKYPEVIARAKELLAKFPAEAGFRELAGLAANEQEKIEREVQLRRNVQEARGWFDARRFEDAVRAAQSALNTFPGNAELQRLLQQAEDEQKQLELRRQMEKGRSDVKGRIDRREYGEAIDLAKQTLSTLGPDNELTQLLNSAQAKLEEQQKRRGIEEALEKIRVLANAGDFDRAGRLMDEAVNARTLDAQESRVRQLGRRIEEGKAAAAAKEAARLEAEAAERRKAEVAAEAARKAAAAAPPARQAPPAPIASSQPASNKTTAAASGKQVKHGSSTREGTAVPSAKTDARVDRQASDVAPTPAAPGAQEGTGTVVLPAAEKARDETKAAGVPLWRKPAVVAVVALAVIAAIWLGVRSLSVKPSPAGQPTTKTAAQTQRQPTQPAKPPANPLEVEQRQALESANKRIAANDLDGAIQELNHAEGLNGPLTGEIKQKLALLEESKKNAKLRDLRQKEAVLWEQAMSRMGGQKYAEAQKDLKQILSLPPGGIHRDDAQRYLDTVIPQQMANGRLLAQGQRSLEEGDFSAARHAADQISQNGGDSSALAAQINQQEESGLKQLEGQVNQLKQGDSESAIQQLKALQPKLQALAGDGGPNANEAMNAANGIPGAVAEVGARLAKKRADTAFQEVLQRYQRANRGNDKNGLIAARQGFQTIAQGGGPHAGEAQQYMTDIEKKLEALNAPPKPAPAVAPKTAANIAPTDETVVRGMVQQYIQAFEDRNADGMKQLWPGIPGKDYESYKNSFGQVAEIRVKILSENVRISPDGQTATVSLGSEVAETPKGQKRPRVNKASWGFQLAKRNGNWVISKVF